MLKLQLYRGSTKVSKQKYPCKQMVKLINRIKFTTPSLNSYICLQPEGCLWGRVPSLVSPACLVSLCACVLYACVRLHVMYVCVRVFVSMLVYMGEQIFSLGL